MHSRPIVVLLLLTLLSLVRPAFTRSLAPAHPLSSREDVVKARQARIRRSDAATSDTCANVDGPLKVRVNGMPTTLGLIDACLCKAGIGSFLTSNTVAEVSVELAGVTATTEAITSLVSILFFILERQTDPVSGFTLLLTLAHLLTYSFARSKARQVDESANTPHTPSQAAPSKNPAGSPAPTGTRPSPPSRPPNASARRR